MTSSTLIEPARVWLRRGALDRRLARGADPNASRALSRRARQLTSPRYRAGLAAGLLRIVEAAEEPRRGHSSQVPLNRHEILVEAESIVELARDLNSSDRLNARGIALVERMLTSGGSPFFSFGPEGELRIALRQARAALHLA